MSSLFSTSIRYSSALFALAFLLSACSDSSISESLFEHTAGISDGSNPVVEDPFVQNKTQVIFEVAVPAYQSNALQVNLNWGGSDIAAEWIGDQFWSASVELPTNTEDLLIVTFLDNDGAMTLGSYEVLYKTGVNTSESFPITADKFVVESWDNDTDGISNLTELLHGTDPLVADDVMLEVRSSLNNGYFEARISNLESFIPADRPYFEDSTDQQPPIYDFGLDSTAVMRTVVLDESGSGSIKFTRDFMGAERSSDQLVETTASRDHDEASITWAGTSTLNSVSAALSESEKFSITTIVTGEQRREQFGELEYIQKRGGILKNVISSQLIGSVIEGSNLCLPVEGSVVITTFSGIDQENLGEPDRTLIMKKQLDDQYWRVRDVFSDSQSVDEYWVDSIGEFYCTLWDQ